MRIMLIEKIGKAGIKVLLFLLKEGEHNTYQITLKARMGTASTRGVLLNLSILGLVAEKQGFGNETIYYLTEKGKEVASLLAQIEEKLASNA